MVHPETTHKRHLLCEKKSEKTQLKIIHIEVKYDPKETKCRLMKRRDSTYEIIINRNTTNFTKLKTLTQFDKVILTFNVQYADYSFILAPNISEIYLTGGFNTGLNLKIKTLRIHKELSIYSSYQGPTTLYASVTIIGYIHKLILNVMNYHSLYLQAPNVNIICQECHGNLLQSKLYLIRTTSQNQYLLGDHYTYRESVYSTPISVIQTAGNSLLDTKSALLAISDWQTSILKLISNTANIHPDFITTTILTPVISYHQGQKSVYLVSKV